MLLEGFENRGSIRKIPAFQTNLPLLRRILAISRFRFSVKVLTLADPELVVPALPGTGCNHTVSGRLG